MQVLGLDQFATEGRDLGHLNEIHRDLLISNLLLLYTMHPNLWNVPTYVFIEANLSQDLAAFVETGVRKRLPHVKFVQQYDAQGRLLPGVLTRHKENLVSYFKRVLDEERLIFTSQISTVSDTTRTRLDCAGGGDGLFSLPTTTTTTGLIREQSEKMMSEAITQLKAFKCIRKGRKITFSGKKNGGGTGETDDLVMALVIAVAWARLPSNMYFVK